METVTEIKRNWQIRMKSGIGQQLEYCFDVYSDKQIPYDHYSSGVFEATQKDAHVMLSMAKERFSRMKWVRMYEIIG